ncbi:hypothetical protein L21SP2_2040 [Salinispira pacifica]|uniref:Uncharacterized protein n=1 Tax=Salinispira pacifica TaxID=1307761 RepID=V5WIL9_9SPIO|nr:hypothetical protein L21SP2_2040 [Salinispira pacifica]
MNLSSLDEGSALIEQQKLSENPNFFASKRTDDYIATRFRLENHARDMFIQLGGNPKIERPYTLTLGQCDWLESWYPQPDVLGVSLKHIPQDVVSFTYGDLFPAFLENKGLLHEKRVYLKKDLEDLIETFGLPQATNPFGELGPVRYIEAQVWDEAIIRDLRTNYQQKSINRSLQD